MTYSAPSIVFGTAGIAAFDNKGMKDVLTLLEKHNIKYLDSASLYVSCLISMSKTTVTNFVVQPNSEATLGKHGAPKRFTIHTKAPGFAPGASSRQSILEGMERSLNDLGVDSVCGTVSASPRLY
jgi:aflatoxin B1 aldehyde reductase